MSPESLHQPVLSEQVIELFSCSDPACNPFENIIVDGTVGGGGHARLLQAALKEKGKLYCFDRDPQALAMARGVLGEDSRIEFIRGSYSSILKYTKSESVCGILLDFGLSTDQLIPERGFSYLHDAPLDMRFDPEIELSAYDIVNYAKVDRLRQIFFQYGEEPLSPRIARRIAETRAKGALRTTGQLAETIAGVVPERFRMKALARIFQALRLEVNAEIEHLEKGLEACWQSLRPGGVFIAISYHSLEDRRVKRFFAAQAKGCICPPRLPICACGRKPSAKILTPSPLRPAPKELRLNPASHSAKLRAARKIAS